MKKRIFDWMITMVVALAMVIGNGASVFAAEVSGALDWAWQVPMEDDEYGFGYGVSSPATQGVYIYVVSYDKLYKIHYTTGAVAAETELGGNVMYSRNSPLITAKKKIVVPLADSKIAVVNRDTMGLEEVITYADGESGYQSNTPAVYDSAENAVYLGSWGGSKFGTYVKVDLDTDENGKHEIKEIVKNKGFYYAGAALDGSYVVFGSEAVGDDSSGNATLYAWNKSKEQLISTEIDGSGAIRSTVVPYEGAYYFTTRGGGLYKAVIDDDQDVEKPVINVTLIAKLGDGSICTPLISDGKIYAGYHNGNKGGVKIIDIDSNSIVTATDNIPAIVADLHISTIGKNKGNLYATYNGMPGGIWDVTNDASYFEPDDKMQQYCMSSIVQPSAVKKIYYTNDSGSLISVKESDPSNKTYRVAVDVGEGGSVSPTNINVKENGTVTLQIAPELGYKVEHIEVDGKKQELGTGAISSYKTNKISSDTTIKVIFKKANPIEETLKVSVQQGNKFYLAHEKLNVKSDLAETKGYTDAVDIETVSALDALVAAHIHIYGNDADLSQYLTMSGGNPSVVMGYKGPAYSSGFAVNENYAADAKGTGYNVNQAPLAAGDRVDFFWYEDANYMDTVTAFADKDGKIFSKTVKEGENIELTMTGYPIMYYGWTPEGPIAGAKVVTLEKQADGSFVMADAVKDKDGKDVVTDADGKAVLQLDPGKHYLTLDKGEYSSKIIMPWLEVTVECDPHDFENGVCKDCGELQVIEDAKIIKETLSDVPEELSGKFNDVDALKTELISRVIVVSGYSAENTEFYDVKLQFKYDGKWIDATEENFPKEGITVDFSYPEGTGGETHDFIISHMFTVTSDRLGTVAGETEQPEVTETETGLRATFNGLSPVSISWVETDDNEQIGGDDPGTIEPADDGKVIADEEGDAPDEVEKAGKATSTGDGFNVMLFGIMAITALAVAAVALTVRKRRV